MEGRLTAQSFAGWTHSLAKIVSVRRRIWLVPRENEIEGDISRYVLNPNSIEEPITTQQPATPPHCHLNH